MNGIEIEGIEEVAEMLEEMTLTEADERKAVREAIKPVKSALEKDTPKGYTGKLSKIKTTVKKDGLATVGIVRAGAWWDKFQEFGTSKQKANVGYFERSVNSSQDQAIEILMKELLDKIK